MKANSWNVDNSMRIASTIARLRTHASRALHEAGYKTGGQSKRKFAESLHATIKIIELRQHLELSARGWVEVAEDDLKIYDGENPS